MSGPFRAHGAIQARLSRRLHDEDGEGAALRVLLLLKAARRPRKPKDQGRHHQVARQSAEAPAPRLRSMQEPHGVRERRRSAARWRES